MTIKSILTGRLPNKALDYCVGLHANKPFGFKLSKARSSKLGDFKYDPRTQLVQVSVNEDLNPYQFLITYVHEVAHRYVFDTQSIMKPHGLEWKRQFQRLMLPLLNTDVFPDDVLRVLAKHMKNPKASTAGDPVLVEVLAKYSADSQEHCLRLKEIALGTPFEFRGKTYIKLQEKRTRALCEEANTHKKYLIPMMVPVK